MATKQPSSSSSSSASSSLSSNPFPSSQRERDVPKLNLALQTLKKNGDIDAEQHQQLSGLVSSGNGEMFTLAGLVNYSNNGWQDTFKKQALALLKVKEVKKTVKEKKKKSSLGNSKSKHLNINTQAAAKSNDDDENVQADELLRKKKERQLEKQLKRQSSPENLGGEPKKEEEKKEIQFKNNRVDRVVAEEGDKEADDKEEADD